jgi:hypothetical protein
MGNAGTPKGWFAFKDIKIQSPGAKDDWFFYLEGPATLGNLFVWALTLAFVTVGWKAAERKVRKKSLPKI